MFIRVKNTPNSPRKSVQIVKSVRIGTSVSQKIVKHVGVATDEEELARLKDLAKILKEELEGYTPLFKQEEIDKLTAKTDNKDLGVEAKAAEDKRYQVDVRGLREEGRFVNGIHDIYGKLFEELGYRRIFKNPARQKGVSERLKQIVLARIANPSSKLASVELLEKQFGVSLNLDLVYKMMDKLDDQAIEKLKKISYDNTRKLFQEKIDIIFFDCTTIYFESFKEDNFRKNGYSKDLKFNQPQVLFALMVTKEGLPIGYEACEGNVYEGHTLVPLLNKVKANYDIDKVIFVADSGMFTKENLVELKKLEYEYIVGCRLRNLKTELQEQILDSQNYQTVIPGYKIGKFSYRNSLTVKDLEKFFPDLKDAKNLYRELKQQNVLNVKGEVLEEKLELSRSYQGLQEQLTKILEVFKQPQILIVSYSEKRALKDAHERMEAIKRLEEKLKKLKNPKNYLSNYGYKKYLQVQGETEISLDEEKITLDAKWDGLHGVVTNSNLSSQEILNQYKNLWQVEESFRVTKHDLKVRPVYHWSPRRVKAHLAICYLAYSLVRYLEYRVKLQYKKLSPEKIRKALLGVQTSVNYHTETKIRFGFPSAMSHDAQKIYKLLNVTRSLVPYIIGENNSGKERYVEIKKSSA